MRIGTRAETAGKSETILIRATPELKRKWKRLCADLNMPYAEALRFIIARWRATAFELDDLTVAELRDLQDKEYAKPEPNHARAREIGRALEKKLDALGML